MTSSIKSAPILLAERLRAEIPIGQSNTLREEEDAIVIGLFAAVRPFFEKEYTELERSFSEELADDLMNDMAQKTIRAVLPLFKNIIPIMPPFMQPMMSEILRFFETGKIPDPEEMDEIEPMMEQFERDYLADQQAETGIEAESIEELLEEKSYHRCRRFLGDLPPDIDTDQLIEVLLRKGMYDSFFRVVEKDIEAYFKRQGTGEGLALFDRMIEDYVSVNSCNYWKMGAERNYGYDIHELDDPAIHIKYKYFLARRIKVAGKVLKVMEFILDGFEKLAAYQEKLRNNLSWMIFGNLDWVQSYIKLQGQTCTEDYALNSAASGLMKAVLNQVYSRANPEDKKLLETALYMIEMHTDLLLSLSILPPTEEVTLNLDQQRLLQKVINLLDGSFQDTINKAKMLRDARVAKDKKKGLPVLGIGFAGPRFEPTPDDDQNRVILNFTSNFRPNESSVAGHPILYGIQTILVPKIVKKPKYQVDVLDGTKAANPEILKYIAFKVLDLLRSHPDHMHQDVKKSFQQALIDRVDAKINVLEEQIAAQQRKKTLAKKLDDLKKQKEELILLKERLSEGNFQALTDEQITYLRERIDEGKNRVCVETVISQASGNAYTLSFAMGSVGTDTVKFQGEDYSLGPHKLIQPCLTRCQMMGVAHTLWADLQHAPDLKQAHDRSLDKGGDGVPAMNTEALQDLVRFAGEEMIRRLQGTIQ